MKIIRGYKTEIAPNNKQTTALIQHAGVARFAYNWGLIEKKKAFDAKTKIPNAIELHRRLNALKPTNFPWMYNSSKCSPQEALRNLDRAFDNFFRKCKQKKAGKKGFPRFKSKKKGIGSFRFTGKIKVYNNHIKLPVLGNLKLKERKYLPLDAKILSATVSEKAGRWYVSIQVEEDAIPFNGNKDQHSIIGVDLGIKTLLVCSDGQKFENPKVLKRNLKKVKRFQRAISRKVKGSGKRKKAVKKFSVLYSHISNIRKDNLHKITTHLTKTKSIIGIEDLNISGMMKNHKLAQSIQDLGLYEWRRQLEYKGKLYNCKIVPVDRFFPSSKKCNICGVLNEELTLSDRVWTCACGAVHDRDENSSKNLEKVAASSTETINAHEGRLPLPAA